MYTFITYLNYQIILFWWNLTKPVSKIISVYKMADFVVNVTSTVYLLMLMGKMVMQLRFF